MVFNIQHTDNSYYRLFSYQKTFKIDLKDQFVKKKPKGHIAGVTKDVAIKILKNIETKAKIKAFFTKPAVLISIAVALIAGSVALSIISGAVLAPLAAIVAMKVMGVLLSLPSALLLPYAIQGKFNGCLDDASRAYSNLAQAARNAINTIKANSWYQTVI